MTGQYQIINGELVNVQFPKQRKGMFKKNGHKKCANKEEVQQIIQLYPDYFNWQLARKFNISESQVLNIKRKYNLKKSNKIINTGRFQKGHIPANKGKQFPNSNIGGNTKFKKGTLPHNTKQNGIITKRYHKRAGTYYYYIRISLAKWQLLQRYIWEKNYGKIPDRHIIRFKDGNDSNFDIDNLECISRAENMEKNRNVKKAAESMKKLWKSEKLRVKYERPQQTKLRINHENIF